MVTLCLVSTTDCYTVTLYPTAALASPLECAHPKNVPVNPLECAVPKSLDLKSPEMNSYQESGGSPLSLRNLRLSIRVHQCSSVVTPFALPKFNFEPGSATICAAHTREQRHESSQRISDGANQAEARIPEHHSECEICSRKKRHPRRPGTGQHAALERSGVRQRRRAGPVVRSGRLAGESRAARRRLQARREV